MSAPSLRVAAIDESRCIGCALCIHACPVDAIAGAPKFMHTVIEPLCTGCELCVAPCPVDCISMQDTAASWPDWTLQWAHAERARGEARRAQAPRKADRAGGLARRGRPPAVAPEEQPAGRAARRAAILAAVARVARRRAEQGPHAEEAWGCDPEGALAPASTASTTDQR